MRRLPQAPPVRRDRGVFVEDAWYAIARARDVSARRPLGLRRFGRELVLFRGDDGRIAALARQCPHRGADLARGRVVGGALACPYHGFRFAPDGRCVQVPCEGADYRIPGALAASTFPVREAHDLVWMWWGEPREVYPEIPWSADMPDRETARTATSTLTWDVALPLAIESNLDLHHAPFAHGRVLPGVGARLDPYEARLEGDTVLSRGTLRRDDGRPYRGRGGLTFALNCRFPAYIFGAFGSTRFCVALAPIDETHTWLVFRYFIDVPVIGGLLARLGVSAELRLVQPDDLEMQRAAARSGLSLHECRFVPSDRAIVLWYGLYRRRISRDAGAAEAPATAAT